MTITNVPKNSASVESLSQWPLDVRGIKKNYLTPRGESFQALKGFDLQVMPGEIFALLGPNGAGKTTLISTITTLEKPSEGSVSVFGIDVTQRPRQAKAALGVVHQEVINTGFFSVEEILEFQSGYYGVRNNTGRIEYLLEKLGLLEHREKKVKQLSGGMKRRLMIAKALVHEPKLLLLDEPTAGVDVGLRESLWNFVLELKKEGLAILLTTHYLEEAEELCGRVAIINKGELKAQGLTKKVIADFSQKKISLLLKPGSGENQRLSTSVRRIKLEPKNGELGNLGLNSFDFLVPMDMTCGDLLTELGVKSEDIVDIKIEEGRLEDAFLKVIEGGGGR